MDGVDPAVGCVLSSTGYSSVVRAVPRGNVCDVVADHGSGGCEGGDRRRGNGVRDDVRHLRADRRNHRGPLQPQVDGDDRRRGVLSRHLPLWLRGVRRPAGRHVRRP